MSGVAIVRYLLSQNANLIAEVPAARIQSGPLPLKMQLPAIGVTQVDAYPRLTVRMVNGNLLMTERVQVTVLTKTYPQKKSLLTLARHALPQTRGEVVAELQCDSILPDAIGPDLDDPDVSIFTQSQDYIVKWIEEGPA